MCTVKIQFVLWIAMETVRFHMAQMRFFFLKTLLNLDPMKIVLGVYGRLN